jgi:hypothetical protein
MVYFACRNAATTKLMLTVVTLVCVAVAAVIAVTTFGLSVARASAVQVVHHDLTGTVVVPFGTSSDPVSCGLTVDEALAVLGHDVAEAPCAAGPLGDWSDVYAGTPVEVTDEAGVLLGTTHLTGGVASGGAVTFDFALEDVPASATYGVQVNARGVVPVTVEDGSLSLDLR